MGVKKNVLYSSVLTISQYVFPLITFPYVSRVLGVSNIGLVNFVDSIVNYFILISMLGISILGVREVASCQNDQGKLNSAFSSLFFIHSLFTFFLLFIYIIAIFCIPQFFEHKELFYIGAAKLLFNLFLIEWFYKGTENFKYITSRSLIIRVLYVLAIFLFVRRESDYIIYFLLTTFMVALNSVTNWWYSKRFVLYSFSKISIRVYLKPFFILGLYLLLTSMYTTFNVAYLGFTSTTEDVGYYTTALKIYTIILGLFTAFTGVMMPRMSVLILNNDDIEFKRMIDKSFSFLFAICFPLMIGTIVLAPQIIELLSGSGYGGAIIPMQLIMPLILVVGIAQVLAIQILMPLNMDKVILRGAFVGTIVGLVFNFLLVHRFQSVGTSVTLFLAEVSVTSYLIYSVDKCVGIKLPYKECLRNLIYSIPYLFFCLLAQSIFNSFILILFVSILLSFLYFIFSQAYLLKNSILLSGIKFFKNYKLK